MMVGLHMDCERPDGRVESCMEPDVNVSVGLYTGLGGTRVLSGVTIRI